MDKTALLPFIVTTPTQKQTGRQNRQIKSHAAKANLPRQRSRKPKPRVPTQDHQTRTALRALAPAEQREAMPTPVYTPIFGLGMDLDPREDMSSTLTSHSLQVVTTFFSLLSIEMYPKELCIGPDRNNDVYWVGTVFHDQVYMHAILAATEVFFGIRRKGSHTLTSSNHSIKALQGLQNKLSTRDNSDSFSDATILAILALAITADLSDDMPTVERHLRGLKRIIDMKGGVGSLRTNIPDLLAKICRLDLGLAVRTWRPTVFFHKSTSWDPYLIVSHSTEQCNDDDMTRWVNGNLETRLRAVWEDLRQFRRMSVSASQTNQKLPRVMFSELMLSLLYRLVNLCYDLDSPNEVVRLGMLAYTSSIFLQWGKKVEFHHLRRMLADTLKGLHTGIILDIPLPGKLWLFFTWHMLQPAEHEIGTLDMWFETVFYQDILPSWSDVQQLLRSTVWIGHMHDVEGQAIYQRAIVRVS